MNCSEFHELAASYALDALPEEERLAALHHLQDEGPHEGCEELVVRYTNTVDRLSAAIKPVEVRLSLWRVIELRLGLASADSVHPLSSRLSPQPSRWREGLAWAAAAAALIGALWSHQTAQNTASVAEQERGTLEEQLSNVSTQFGTAEAARRDCVSALQQLREEGRAGHDAVALLEQPTTTVTPMGPAGAQTYRATTLYNPAAKRAMIISTTVPKVDGKDYELWVIAGNDPPKPAGFLRFDPSGVAIGEFDAKLLQGTPAAFAVSLEPAGGNPTPTEVVLLGKLAG